MPVNRKLVAVMMADVVGYSRLMERDEAGTHQRLRALDAELVTPKIAEHGGRTVKTAGDGMLIEFASATAALRCAVEVQRAMAERNRDVAADEQIRFRIGINLGDIIVEGDDIIGDGVNVAARLEALAKPGGICVASAIWEQVHEDLGVEFIDAGDQHVKNISKPIHVYRVALAKGASSSVRGRTPARRLAVYGVAALAVAVAGVVTWQALDRPRPQVEATPGSRRTVMVMPFRATDASLAPLATVLSAETTRQLALTMRRLTIVAPEVAAAAVAAGGDPRAIAQRANASYLFDGEVRPQGDEVVVQLRLIDTLNAKELGSTHASIRRDAGAVDREMLGKRVTYAARALYYSASPTSGSAPLGPNATPQDMVDRARYLRYFGGPALSSIAEPRKLLDEALRLDPSLVDAWIMRADLGVKAFSIDFAGADDARLLDEMERDSLQAVALDDLNIEAWLTRGWVLMFEGRLDAAFEANDRAQRIDPTAGFYLRANLLNSSGRSDETLRLIASRHAVLGRNEPGYLKMSCEAKLNLGDYRGAIADCERAASGFDNPDIPVFLTAAYAQVGDLERAARARDEAMRLLPTFSISRNMKKWSRYPPEWQAQQRDHLVPGWRKAGMPE